MKIRMIASDLDGTLLDPSGHITERTLRALNAAYGQGIRLVAATGRSLHALPEDLFKVDRVDRAITSNGSSIFSLTTGERIYGIDMHPITVRRILDIARAHALTYEIFISGSSYCSEAYYRDPVRYSGSPRAVSYVHTTRTPVADLDAFAADHISRIEGMDFIISDPVHKAEIHRLLKAIPDLYITSSSGYYLEMADHRVSKAAALMRIAREYDIRPEEILVFGDGINDLEMFSAAGHSAAMGNAREELKAAAEQVILSNAEDGIAAFLEQHLLI